MKRLLYGLPLIASLAFAEQIGNEFKVLSEEDQMVLAATYSRIANAKIAGSDSTEVIAKVDSLFKEALSQQDSTTGDLTWVFNINENYIVLVGMSEDSTKTGTPYVLGDSVSVAPPEAIPKQPRSQSPLSVTGVRVGLNNGAPSLETAVVFGNRLVISGSPYTRPNSRNPKAKTGYTEPDPTFGTMYETTVDTTEVIRRMKELALGIILPPYKSLEFTVEGGFHWEKRKVEGYAETQKVDRNKSPLTHADARQGPFKSSKKSKNYLFGLGAEYPLTKNGLVGAHYRRADGNKIGVTYRRNF